MNGRKTGRTPLYSRSGRHVGAQPPWAGDPSADPSAGRPAGASAAPAPGAASPSSHAPAPAGGGKAAAAAGGAAARRRWLPAWGLAALAGTAFGIGLALMAAGRVAGPALTQKDIDRAVLHTLQTQELPSSTTRAYEAVAPSLVRVVGKPMLRAPAAGPRDGAARPTTPDQPDDDEDGTSVGSGVVIVDTGVILTNLHVVAGSAEVHVTFADGTESEASVVNVMPEQDLAVLRAHRIPDDLKAATLRSTGDLRPGDRVTAVGFPFGIGPTVSAGVVSGLKREFRSPEGKQSLSNLIQFDAMANPGSSGGPLVTDDGAVVGIVTAIYNPVQQRFFVGIGFAVPIESAAAGAGLPPF